MRAIDISMPLFEGMPAFPGDPPFVVRPVARVDRGGPYNLSHLSFGSHAGTHLDPPAHFFADGVSADRLDLDTLNGPATVLRTGPDVRAVSEVDLSTVPDGTTRLLLRTANSARWARRLEFFEDFVGLTMSGARRLVDLGVRLVGIDALSIETALGGTFPVHRELLGRGVVVLEGLLLDGVEPGDYELRCLPLALRDGDGGPARAVLHRR